MNAAAPINTIRSYQSAIQYWQGWYQLRYGAPLCLPVSVGVVVQFIIDHTEKPRGTKKVMRERCYGLPESVEAKLIELKLKGRRGAPALSTVIHRVAVLSKQHQLAYVANPAGDLRVRNLLREARRTDAVRAKHKNSKRPFTLDLLRKLVDTCEDDLRGRRDRALLIL